MTGVITGVKPIQTHFLLFKCFGEFLFLTRLDGDRVKGVTTNCGNIRAEYVVNCAGMWARQFGELAGVIANLHLFFFLIRNWLITFC